MGFFGNMMNSYMYGKAGKADYRIEDMPKDRFRLFGEVLKVRWSAMFGLNLFYMIFWIPTLVWTVLNLLSLLTVTELATGELEGRILSYLLLLAPCIAITGPFTAGITYVSRNWARDQHSFVLSDFRDAVKGNWKQALPISLISAFVPIGLCTGWLYYGQMAKTNPVFYLPLAIILMLAAMWKLSEPTIYVMMVTYELSFRALLQNGFIMTIAQLPRAVAIKLLTWLLPIVCYVISLIAPSATYMCIGVILILYIFWFPAFNRLLECSFGNFVCEKYLNPKIDGARTGIGLNPNAARAEREEAEK